MDSAKALSNESPNPVTQRLGRTTGRTSSGQSSWAAKAFRPVRPNRNCNIAGIGISTHIPLTRLRQTGPDYSLFPSFASLISTALPPVLQKRPPVPQKRPPVLQKNRKVQKSLIKKDNFFILVGSSLQSPCFEAVIAKIPCSRQTHPCIALAETARREARQWPEMLPGSGAQNSV